MHGLGDWDYFTSVRRGLVKRTWELAEHIVVFRAYKESPRYKIGEKVAGTYAPYFGALVPLRLCRARARP